MSNIANKRIAVTTAVWETLSGMKRPGETFSELIEDLVDKFDKFKEYQLMQDLDEASKGEFVRLEEAKKILGLKE
jgi:predicted CopG family antitoxin